MISVGSLFSGIGGVELGLERSGGFRTVWFCESEPYCQAVLRKHWPGIPIYGDIKQTDWSTVERPDMLTGGFPCQDLSYAGKRAGIKEGNRSGLWKEYFKAIGALRPRIALIENVPGILNGGLNIVLADLAKIGYDAEWFSLRASDVGAPHRRERIFIIAHSSSIGLCEQENEQELGKERWSEFQFRKSRDKANVAYSEAFGCVYWGVKEQSAECWKYAFGDSSSSSADVAHAENSGTLWGEWAQANVERQIRGRRRDGIIQWGDTEPCVGRVADGVPSRVDRIKALGNAVVPQVAEVIGKAILEVV